MNWWSSVALALSLAIDATAVSITNGLVYTKLSKKRMILSAILFGVFQAGMPLIGYLLMSLSSLNDRVNNFVKGIDHWIALVLLVFLGGKMIFDCVKDIVTIKKTDIKEVTNSEGNIDANEQEDGQKVENDEQPKNVDVSLKTLFVQAIATSIDAFAIGISLYAEKDNTPKLGDLKIWWIFLIIGVVTFLCSILGSIFGKKIGTIVKKVAPIIGGLVLIAIGISIVIEHMA